MIWFAFAVFCFMVPPSTGQSNDDYSSYGWTLLKRHLQNGNEFKSESTLNESDDIISSTRQNNNSDSEQFVMDVFRLPTDVFPVSYTLEVSTDFENLAYSGRVEIDIQATAPTCHVILNSKDLRITGIRVVDKKINTSLKLEEYYLVEKNEQFVVVLNKTSKCLSANRLYTLKVEFEAPLRNDMIGYYKSSYKENNVTKWLAVTKFEPTYARKAFPCFDEPALKASFKIALKRRSDQISLSNMPLLNSTKIQKTNMYWDYFQETPPISTYLVAFFVGEFYAMKTRNIGIYTHKSYVSQAQYIANKSPSLLIAMENFTGIDYMLPKLDLLAIPDFVTGAMENWGLNTFREIWLLLPENSNTKMKEFVMTVVQHELSHQWFGDLVTCAWWDYLWLNEGFATFFEYFATKTVEPNWRLEEVFVIEVHQSALKSDQIPRHPITGSVNTPAQIKSIFDDISYSKAGTVLRMLQYSVTEDNFKEALNYYLKNNKYNAVTPNELWIAFENVLIDNDFELDEDISVTQYMKSWTEQAGYPLVTIARVNNTFIITQERFLIQSLNETDPTEWIIGLTYTTENERDFDNVLPRIWMNENHTVLPNKNETGWYIFNLQSIGFYRVNYEEENWNALKNQLKKNCTVIHVLNRAQIIDDLFNLARANRVNYTLVLKVSEYLITENDVMPWYSSKIGFSYLLNRMTRCPNGYKYLKVYVRYLAGLIYAKIEHLIVHHKTTDHSIKTAWNAFSRWACNLDDVSCTKSAKSYFISWQQGNEIPSDIKDAAFCIGVKYGNSEVWNSILNVYINSESASDRRSALMSLACSKDPIQLSKYLDFMFEGYDSPIRPQDFKVIYQTLALYPKGVSALVEFLTNKLDRIINEVINGEQVATSIYSLVASRVYLSEDQSKIDNLRKNSSIPLHIQKNFNSSYKVVDENLVWFNRYHSEIGHWANKTVHKLGLAFVVPNPIDYSTNFTHNNSSNALLNIQTFVLILGALLFNTHCNI